jgi:hypothetical protein
MACPPVPAVEYELATESGIRRIVQDRTPWRVAVETWPARDGFHGRFVFAPEHAPDPNEKRAGPAALRGSTREDVIAQAYNLPENQLRQLLRSLG